MSDARLRELERRSAATRSPEDGAAWVREATRAGIAKDRIDLLVHLGYPPALEAAGELPAPPPTFEAWVAGLERWGREALVRAAVGAARAAAAVLRVDSRLERDAAGDALAAADAWVACPCDEHVGLAMRAADRAEAIARDAVAANLHSSRVSGAGRRGATERTRNLFDGVVVQACAAAAACVGAREPMAAAARAAHAASVALKGPFRSLSRAREALRDGNPDLRASEHRDDDGVRAAVRAALVPWVIHGERALPLSPRAAALAALRLSGALPPARLELAALMGDEDAGHALGPSAPAKVDDVRALADALGAYGRDVLATAALAAARLVVPEGEARGQELLALAQAWLDAPGARQRAVDALRAALAREAALPPPRAAELVASVITTSAIADARKYAAAALRWAALAVAVEAAGLHDGPQRCRELEAATRPSAGPPDSSTLAALGVTHVEALFRAPAVLAAVRAGLAPMPDARRRRG